MFIHFLCLCPPRLDSLSCLILIYRKWPIGCKGIARALFFLETKNGTWKSDEIFVNKKLDQAPPPLSLQILITVHTFFSDMYKNVKL